MKHSPFVSSAGESCSRNQLDSDTKQCLRRRRDTSHFKSQQDDWKTNIVVHQKRTESRRVSAVVLAVEREYQCSVCEIFDAIFAQSQRKSSSNRFMLDNDVNIVARRLVSLIKGPVTRRCLADIRNWRSLTGLLALKLSWCSLITVRSFTVGVK